MYQKVAPMLLVENVEEAVEWYGKVLGAKLQSSLPKNPPFEWTSLGLGDVEIMFSKKRSAQKWYSDAVIVSETPANFIAYIYVENADNLYERIKDNVKIAMEPTDQWYGLREFAIRDPFGFISIFAQIIG